MDELSTYRCRIGLFAYTAYQKSSDGKKPKQRQRKSVPIKKKKGKPHTTTDVFVKPERNHCTLALVLLLVSFACSIERHGYLPEISYQNYIDWLTGNDALGLEYSGDYPGNCYYRHTVSFEQEVQIVPTPIRFLSEYKEKCLNLPIPYTKIPLHTLLKYMNMTSSAREKYSSTIRSFGNYLMLNHKNIPLPATEKSVSIGSSGDYTPIKCKDIPPPVGVKPVCAIHSYKNNTLLNYSDLTSQMRQEPIYTVTSYDNYTMLSYRAMSSPVKPESVHTITSCANYTLLNYRTMPLPVKQETVYTVAYYGNSTLSKHTAIKSPVRQEIVYTVTSCYNYAVLNCIGITSPFSVEQFSAIRYVFSSYRAMTLPVTEKLVNTVTSWDNYMLLNYGNITSPISEEYFSTINSADKYTHSNYRAKTSPVKETLVHNVTFCDNVTVLYYSDMALPVSERQLCTTNSSKMNRLLNNMNITSLVRKEQANTVIYCEHYTRFIYMNMILPLNEEPVLSFGPGTCSYLLGNKGCNCSNREDIGEAWMYQETVSLTKKERAESVGYIKGTTSCDNAIRARVHAESHMIRTCRVFRQELVQVNEEQLCTDNSSDICRLLNNMDIISLARQEQVYKVSSCDHCTRLIFLNLLLSLDEEPVCTVIFCGPGTCSYLLGNKGCHISNGNRENTGDDWRNQETVSLIKKDVDESEGYIKSMTSRDISLDTGVRVHADSTSMRTYRMFRQGIVMESHVSEEQLCTASSNINRLLNNMNITSLARQEQVYKVSSCDHCKRLIFLNLLLPLDEEPVCTVIFCGPGTCSYLLGNKGCHSSNGNRDNTAEVGACIAHEPLRLIKKNVDESAIYIKTTTFCHNTEGVKVHTDSCVMRTYPMFIQEMDKDTKECITLMPTILPDAVQVNESRSQRTCPYLLGNSGQHCYNGNPPKFGNKDKHIEWLHREMIIKLSEEISPSLGEAWDKFKSMLTVYLSSVAICEANNILKVCEALEKEKIIEPGQYDVLKEIFTVSKLHKCCEILHDYSEQIQNAQMSKKRPREPSPPEGASMSKKRREAPGLSERASKIIMNVGTKLYSGTGITSPTTKIVGTVGAFVEDISGRTAFVTTAHAVVPWFLSNRKNEERQQYLLSHNIPVAVYKNGQMGEQVGNVINWCFFGGTENQKCVDVALVEVDKRSISTENMFPQIDDNDWKFAGYNPNDQPKISENRILTFKEINDKTAFGFRIILKYGYTSRVSLGHFVYAGAGIKVYNNVNISHFGKEQVVMHGLVGVKGYFNRQFSKLGDAGALCYIRDTRDHKKLYPFGMVVECDSSGVTYVALLEDAFQMLNLDLDEGIKLYPFSDPPLRLKTNFLRSDT